MAAVGTHCILEMYDCPPCLLDDREFVEHAIRAAVGKGLATLIDQVSHKFSPQGVTALALVAESHMSVHTWPEHGYVAADVFTCGDTAKPVAACKELVRMFEAGRYSLRTLPRGMQIPDVDVVKTGKAADHDGATSPVRQSDADAPVESVA